jgi:AraC-like DNA-binding protein
VNHMHPVFVGEVQSHSVHIKAPPHAHAWTQVAIPLAQSLTVMTRHQAIFVPPLSAIWMPAGVVHRCFCSGQVDVKNVSLNPEACERGPENPCILSTTPFVRELICHMASLSPEQCDSGYAVQLMDVLLASAKPSSAPMIAVRMPRDRRLQLIAQTLLEDFLDERSLQEWSGIVGASYRTLARRFTVETSLTFNEWRQSIRVVEAASRLARGDSVCNVAAGMGYASVAGFTAMFKRIAGITPSEYQRGVSIG